VSRLTLLANEVFVSLLDLLRAQAPPRKTSLMLGERSVAIFLERMKNELHEPWTLELMAERSGLARTRFAHYCRKLTNLSPMEYLQRQRVEKAKLLLAGAGLSITEIALNCGFASSAYFASAFRRHAHCSPREYRDAAKKPM
jgi:AraC-like DNA-binding protein